MFAHSVDDGIKVGPYATDVVESNFGSAHLLTLSLVCNWWGYREARGPRVRLNALLYEAAGQKGRWSVILLGGEVNKLVIGKVALGMAESLVVFVCIIFVCIVGTAVVVQRHRRQGFAESAGTPVLNRQSAGTTVPISV